MPFTIPFPTNTMNGFGCAGTASTEPVIITSHTRAARQLGKSFEQAQFLSAHLGNGCSATAVRNGRSVDATMGLTPLEGLMMGTRSGDVDPSLHLFLHQERTAHPGGDHRPSHQK